MNCIKNYLFQTDLEITGDLEISLTYKQPQTLVVKVHAGHDITNKYEEDGAPNPFVKMAIPGIAVVHKTKVKNAFKSLVLLFGLVLYRSYFSLSVKISSRTRECMFKNGDRYVCITLTGHINKQLFILLVKENLDSTRLFEPILAYIEHLKKGNPSLNYGKY